MAGRSETLEVSYHHLPEDRTEQKGGGGGDRECAPFECAQASSLANASAMMNE